jgi:glycosyltransferase involved in cell wall biosynthesis
VGVHRVLRLCRYASQYGWRPIVVAPRADGVAFIDNNLSARIPSDVLVRRTGDFDPVKWLARRSHPPAPSNGHPAATPGRRPDYEGVHIRALRWLKNTLRDVCTRTPDSHIFWLPFAVAAGGRVLLTHPVDLIFCSTPPHSTVLAAFILAVLFRKPYVLDFRDPWLGKNWPQVCGDKSRLLLRVENAVRRLVMTRASLIITPSPGERQDLLEDMPTLAPERVVSVTNGYDPLDFPALPPMPRRHARLVMTHTGTVYPGTADELFAALESLSQEMRDLERRLEVNLVGAIGPEYDRPVRRLQDKGILRTHGLRPHAEALQWAAQSDVLVILLGGQRFLESHLPAKTFEYLHVGKPILAVARDGDAARILRESGLGILVPPHDVEALKHAISRFCDAKDAGRPLVTPAPHYAARFEAAALVRQMTGHLDETLCRIGVSDRDAGKQPKDSVPLDGTMR